jgi:deoxyribonuclease V
LTDQYNNDEYNALQQKLAEQLDFSPASLYKPKRDDIIITIDVLYTNEIAAVGIDITAWPHQPIKILTYQTKVSGQYIPGYFSFYEGPVIIETLDWLKEQNIIPALLVVDGHGLAHPRYFGLACYVGVKTGVPVIGVAKKNLLHYNAEGLSKKRYVEHGFYREKEKIGIAIRLQENKAPVFISPGNKISLETSIAVIKQMTTEYKFPDNIRRADQASRSTG